MAIVIEEGIPPILVIYGDWAEWRHEQRTARPERAPLVASHTCFCASCWGAGCYFEPAQNGEGLVPRTCPVCAGTGSIPL